MSQKLYGSVPQVLDDSLKTDAGREWGKKETDRPSAQKGRLCQSPMTP